MKLSRLQSVFARCWPGVGRCWPGVAFSFPLALAFLLFSVIKFTSTAMAFKSFLAFCRHGCGARLVRGVMVPVRVYIENEQRSVLLDKA